MTNTSSITIYGEVLFDSFANGERILGGAPFNICWHLQAFGDKPVLISRIGRDKLGNEILEQVEDWGINSSNLQIDSHHPTGQVQVTVLENEPQYIIMPNSAYDFIEYEPTHLKTHSGILYHGSLALRSQFAQEQFEKLKAAGDWKIFLDVNLRAPWWDKESLFQWLEDATWVKLNLDELHELGFVKKDIEVAMKAFRERFNLEQLIVTCGENGCYVLTEQGLTHQPAGKLKQFVDTVGAGDSFTAVYIHGLMNQWPLEKTLKAAQGFAADVIGLRGATTQDRTFYEKTLKRFNEI